MIRRLCLVLLKDKTIFRCSVVQADLNKDYKHMLFLHTFLCENMIKNRWDCTNRVKMWQFTHKIHRRPIYSWHKTELQHNSIIYRIKDIALALIIGLIWICFQITWIVLILKWQQVTVQIIYSLSSLIMGWPCRPRRRLFAARADIAFRVI